MPSDPLDQPPQLPNLTDAELELIKELWDHGAATVRELHGRATQRGSTWAYTTVQTMLTRLAEKGFVRVDRTGIAHRFEAAVDRDSLVGQRLDELVAKVCDGAVAPLLLNLVSRQRFKAEDIARFRALLDECEEESP